MTNNTRMRRQKGASLFVAILSLLLIVPMVGLMVDVAVLYAVKAQLQASVDGASLAAARALTLGATTTAQATSAKQNAVNWFYANFPTGSWGTTNTQMDQSSVSVFDDPNNSHVRNVTITATTTAPTYFMRYLNFNGVTVTANGNASRRDVVMMMVLDRSGSMGGVCGTMIQYAKQFTGAFAEGRDQIGLVSFSDNVYLHSAPTANFQTVLGYSNASGSGTGEIDKIVCRGGTSTPQAISIAYNELLQANLPGALNVVMFETDGLPNTLNMNFWDSVNNVSGLTATNTKCLDRNGKTMSTGGFTTSASIPNWTPGATYDATTVPAGMVGEVYSADPSQGTFFYTLMKYSTTVSGFGTSPAFVGGTGCSFDTTQYTTSVPVDFQWFPSTDIYGNQLNPATSPYQSVTMTANGRYVQNNNWTNYHRAVLNATDNAAYRARTNGTIPAYFFGIGLGGNGGDQPDFILMQRMANDPAGDEFNTPAKYLPCAQEAGCVTYASQPQGTFIFAPTAQQLGQAFLTISSQILRLSK